jgi:hypothetical protein
LIFEVILAMKRVRLFATKFALKRYLTGMAPRLSGGAVAFAVGYFLKLVAR